MARTALSFFVVVFLFGCSTHALALESIIGLSTLKPGLFFALESEFKDANLLTPTNIQGSWNCEVYGARTLKQTLHKKSLYTFDTSTNKTFENRGSHLFKHYKFSNSQLISQRGGLIDVIRMTSNGELLIETSVNKSDLSTALKKGLPSNYLKNGIILSLSRCKK